MTLLQGKSHEFAGSLPPFLKLCKPPLALLLPPSVHLETQLAIRLEGMPAAGISVVSRLIHYNSSVSTHVF